jgi:plastocyanin
LLNLSLSIHADTASEVGERREATSTTDESATEYSLDGYNVNGDNFDNNTGQTASVISGRGDNNNTNTRVSLVPGSTSLTRIAYQPNPTQVSTGATVTWTNNDLQPHTVTSGENAEADGRFDSGIMAPTRTFEHTFTQPGQYPYFCILHANMVGTVKSNYLILTQIIRISRTESCCCY